MRFWDSSAVAPLLVEQATTAAARGWADEDPDLAIWTLTPVEICSAVHRLVRDGALELAQARQVELAAALAWAGGNAAWRILHSLDARLAAAAEREGFSVPKVV